MSEEKQEDISKEKLIEAKVVFENVDKYKLVVNPIVYKDVNQAI